MVLCRFSLSLFVRFSLSVGLSGTMAGDNVSAATRLRREMMDVQTGQDFYLKEKGRDAMVEREEKGVLKKALNGVQHIFIMMYQSSLTVRLLFSGRSTPGVGGAWVPRHSFSDFGPKCRPPPRVGKKKPAYSDE